MENNINKNLLLNIVLWYNPCDHTVVRNRISIINVCPCRDNDQNFDSSGMVRAAISYLVRSLILYHFYA